MATSRQWTDTDVELDAIEARADAADVPALAAQVRRLAALLAERGQLEEIGDDLREQLILEGAVRALVFAAEFFGDPCSFLSNYAAQLRSGEQKLPDPVSDPGTPGDAPRGSVPTKSSNEGG